MATRISELSFATKKEIRLTCMHIIQGIYGNVKATLMHYMVYINHLYQKLGMTQSLTDLCAFSKKDKEGIIAMNTLFHVDNTLNAKKTE